MTNKMMKIAGRSEGGLTKGIQTDSDGRPNVIVKNQAGEEFIGKRFSKEFSVSETQTLIDMSNGFVIDFLEWSTNSDVGQISLFNKSNGGVSNPENGYGLLSNDGTGVKPIRPAIIGDVGAGPFDIIEHNTNQKLYKYRLKEKMYFPEGAIIQLRNPSDENINLSVIINGRVLN